MDSNVDVSAMLVEWSKERKAEVLNRLLPVIYAELRGQARRYLRREAIDHSLQSTELINEAYMKLVGQKNLRVENRQHFFAIAANLMREILVDHARRKNRIKRGGNHSNLQLREDLYVMAPQKEIDLMALDQALSRLATMDEQQARVVEMKFFGGLEIAEIADVLGISPATVKRDWNSAKVWLRHELSRSSGRSSDAASGEAKKDEPDGVVQS